MKRLIRLLALAVALTWGSPAAAANIVQLSDVLANDSDKTFTVPAGRVWRVLSVYVKLVSTATVGNRGMVFSATDGADAEVYAVPAAPTGVGQAASLTRYYTAAQGLGQLAAFNVDKMTTPLGELILLAGYKLRVRDAATIDAAADDMDVRIMIEESIQ